MGGTFDLGVLFTRYNVIGPDRETPLICGQWECQRELLQIWTGLDKSNKQAVFISCRVSVWRCTCGFSAVSRCFPTSGVNSTCACVLVYAHVSACIAVCPLSVVSAAQEITFQKHYIIGLEDSKWIPFILVIYSPNYFWRHVCCCFVVVLFSLSRHQGG